MICSIGMGSMYSLVGVVQLDSGHYYGQATGKSNAPFPLPSWFLDPDPLDKVLNPHEYKSSSLSSSSYVPKFKAENPVITKRRPCMYAA